MTTMEADNDDKDDEGTTSATAFRLIVAVGTYDGVLAGWELNYASNDSNDDDETIKNEFKISFASPVHDGSVRSVTIASSAAQSQQQSEPGVLLSSGYDEVLRTHDFAKKLTSLGEIRTPDEFGTPTCASFAPPTGNIVSTHCLVGFSEGKLVIYKKRDWSVQHVLAGHEHGVASLAVHPSGKMALSAGVKDGKLKLWDLTKGRLAYATKIPSKDPITTLVWNADGTAYALAHGSHLTVRDVATGSDLLDVELPSKVNQICFMQGKEGLFVAAAGNDGSLPVLSVGTVGGDDNKHKRERLAVMAIEPVEGPVAGEDRFKCIHAVKDYYVVTANSAGVISLMNLQGAVNMILQDKKRLEEQGDQSNDDEDENEGDSNDDSDDDDDEDKELAVDIIASTRLGTGARITCLSAWYSSPSSATINAEEEEEDDESDQSENENVPATATETKKPTTIEKYDRSAIYKRKWEDNQSPELEMNKEAIDKARKLVAKAKKIQKRKEKKRAKASR